MVDITVKCPPRVLKQLTKDKSTWYIIVSSSDGRIVAFKRYATSLLTCSIKLNLASTEDVMPSKIHLISDTIFGLDQSADLNRVN